MIRSWFLAAFEIERIYRWRAKERKKTLKKITHKATSDKSMIAKSYSEMNKLSYPAFVSKTFPLCILYTSI